MRENSAIRPGTREAIDPGGISLAAVVASTSASNNHDNQDCDKQAGSSAAHGGSLRVVECRFATQHH